MTAYATRAELSLWGGLPAAVIAGFSPEAQDAQLEAASALVDEAFGRHFSLPLVLVPLRVKLCVARIAAFLLMASRGFDPNRGADALVKQFYDAEIAWLGQVESGDATATGAVDQTPDVDEGGARVYADKPRGY